MNSEGFINQNMEDFEMDLSGEGEKRIVFPKGVQSYKSLDCLIHSSSVRGQVS